MQYLVDGHNLIPHIPGLSLRDMDDEQALIDLLVRFAAAGQHNLEVFFDRAPIGFSGARRYSRVLAHFVRQGKLADTAIRERLEQLGGSARNVVVVSSDRQVQAEAHAHGARAFGSAEFAASLAPYRPAPEPPQTKAARRKARAENPAASVSADDVQAWLDLFGGEPQEGVPPPPKKKKPRKGS